MRAALPGGESPIRAPVYAEARACTNRLRRVPRLIGMKQMSQRHRLAGLLAAAALALAAPGAALAQNAGDNQYSDPFGSGGDSQGQTGSGSNGSGGSSQTQPSP